MEKEGEILRKYLKANGINQEELATKLNMTRQGLNYHFQKEKLDYEFKQLLREHGVEAFTENGRRKQEEARPYNMVQEQTVLMDVPIVNQYAYAGYLRGYSDEEYLENLPKLPWLVDKEYKGVYRIFEVRGDSMDDGSSDSYLEGDKVLARQISKDHWKSKLHIKKWDFVLVHKTEGIMIKKITEHQIENGILKLHSLNPLYEDFTVSLKDIVEIYNVVQVARKK
ncbi:MAG: S24 family peptidase [Chitinophagales bacterium]